MEASRHQHEHHEGIEPGRAHLAGVDVRAPAVHVRVVREEDVLGRARLLRDARARVARDNDVRDLAVLADDAEAEGLGDRRVVSSR